MPEPFRKHASDDAGVRIPGELAPSFRRHDRCQRLTDVDGFAPFSKPTVPKLAQPPRARVDQLTREEMEGRRR